MRESFGIPCWATRTVGSAREPPIDVKSHHREFSGVETAGESIRSHSEGALLSGHAFHKIENPGSG
jgi:hypothetical protein